MERSQVQPKVIITESQAKRLGQNVKGIVISVLACLALVIPIYLLAPQPAKQTYVSNINVADVAAQAAPVLHYTPVVPQVPNGWTANFARVEALQGPDVPRWELGYLVDGKDYVQVSQTNQSSPSWLLQQTDSAPITGHHTINGVDWELRDKPQKSTYLIYSDGPRAVVLSGNVPLTTLDALAKATDVSRP